MLSTSLTFNGKIRVRENPCSVIFYAVIEEVLIFFNVEVLKRVSLKFYLTLNKQNALTRNRFFHKHNLNLVILKLEQSK